MSDNQTEGYMRLILGQDEGVKTTRNKCNQRIAELEAENAKLRKGLQEAKLEHRICFVECISFPEPRKCDCGHLSIMPSLMQS